MKKREGRRLSFLVVVDGIIPFPCKAKSCFRNTKIEPKELVFKNLVFVLEAGDPTASVDEMLAAPGPCRMGRRVGLAT